MYEIPKGFEDYFNEEDILKRKELLDALMADSELSGKYAYAKELFDNRYVIPKRKLGEVDTFLYSCMVLISLHKSGIFFKGSNTKEARQMLENMGVYTAKSDIDITLMYYEMRNAVRRYFKTCFSPSYRKKLFGLMNSSDEDRAYGMLSDAWKMSIGTSEKYGLSEDMKVWNEAVRAEFEMAYSGDVFDLDNFSGK